MPTISGTAQVGETLTASTSGIADADGLTNATFSYQWLADGAVIAGANSSTFTLISDDEGRTIRVRVTFTDDEGHEESLTSDPTGAVVAAPPPNTPPTGAPSINGTTQVGETLAAVTSGIEDDDGLDNAVFAYQWIAGGADIEGATGSGYRVAAEDRNNHSNRRERVYARRRNFHARIVNVRSDNHHKATTAIAKASGRGVVETLNVAGMVHNRRLARALADAGMAGFLSKLEYKCAWYGAECVKADRWYASSKLCAHCGWKNDDLTLSDRQWWCGGCGMLNERDRNAAGNLERWPGLNFPVSGRGDRVRPATPAVVVEASMDSALQLPGAMKHAG